MSGLPEEIPVLTPEGRHWISDQIRNPLQLLVRVRQIGGLTMEQDSLIQTALCRIVGALEEIGA
jgi:hypothetical protein